MKYYAEYYFNNRLFRTPTFTHIQDLTEYMNDTGNGAIDFRVYVED